MPNIFSRLYLRLIEKRNPIRAARLRGVKVGVDCRFVGTNSFGSEPYLITIGDHVSITKTSFITHDGAIWVARKDHPDLDIVAPIRVGNNVFIGSGTVVLPGVTIGDNVVVGAMSVVTRDIPSNTVSAGIPAKPIRSTDEYIERVIPKAIATKKLSPEEKKRTLLRLLDEKSRA